MITVPGLVQVVVEEKVQEEGREWAALRNTASFEFIRHSALAGTVNEDAEKIHHWRGTNIVADDHA